MTRRFWTTEEREHIRRWYRQRLVRDIAAEINRSVKAVYTQAMELGLTETKLWWNERDDRIMRQLNADGWSDQDIADELGRDRHCVSMHRSRAGLPSNAYGTRWKDRNKKQRRRQCEDYGVKNMGEYRSKRFQKFASERGWPGLSVRGAQIADLLYERGPHTREEICKALDMPTHNDNQRKRLAGRVPGGMYTAELIRAGVVVALTRKRRQGGKGKNVTEYAIAPGTVRGKPETWRKVA